MQLNSRVRRPIKTTALAITVLSLLSPAASACSDPIAPSFQENLARAEHIFVLRLTSLELAGCYPWLSNLKGNINVVRVLKGAAPATADVALEGSRCGIKLVVGRYYLAVLESDPGVLRLLPGDQSILDVTDDFKAGEPGRAPNPYGLWPVQQYLLGHALPADYPSEYQLESTLRCPLPSPGQQRAPDNSFNGMPLRGTP